MTHVYKFSRGHTREYNNVSGGPKNQCPFSALKGPYRIFFRTDQKYKVYGPSKLI